MLPNFSPRHVPFSGQAKRFIEFIPTICLDSRQRVAFWSPCLLLFLLILASGLDRAVSVKRLGDFALEHTFKMNLVVGFLERQTLLTCT